MIKSKRIDVLKDLVKPFLDPEYTLDEYMKKGSDFMLEYLACERCDGFSKQKLPLYEGIVDFDVVFWGTKCKVDFISKLFGVAGYGFINTSSGCSIRGDLAKSSCVYWKKRALTFLPNLKVLILLGVEAYVQFMGIKVPAYYNLMNVVYEVDVCGKKVLVLPIPSPLAYSYHPEYKSDTLQFLTEFKEEFYAGR